MLASLALYSSARGRAALAEGVGLASEGIAESLSVSMDMLIQLRSHEVLTVSDSDCVISEVSDSNAAFDAMEDPQAYIDEIDENWTSTPLDDIPESMATILEGDISLMLRSQLVDHYLTEHSIAIFGEIIVTNRYGAIVAATHRPSDYRQDDEGWWQNAFSGERELYHSDIEYDQGSGVYGVCACMSVKDGAGVVIGAAKAVINILAIANDIEDISLGYETSELKITTSDGRLIFSSRAYVMLQNVSSTPFFGQVTDSRGHFVEREGETNRMFSYVVSTGYHDYEGSNWIVFLSHSEDEVLGPATGMQVGVLTVAVLAIVLGAVIATALSRSITSPIAELEAVTRRMARGELDQRIDSSRKDELGRLAKSFNDMASELDRMYSDLDIIVKERTKELEKVNKKLGVLASITRHDALNQMTIQKGWLGMAIGTSKDPAVRDHLRKVEVTTDNLVALMKFSSEYEEIGVNKPEWLDLSEALSTAVESIDLSDVKLEAQLQGVEVFADPMFPRVLHNLISNSLKHGKTVTAVSLSYSEGTEGLTIVMTDDGVGVPAERKGGIFQRTPETGKRSHGLFLSAEILEITGISIMETGVEGEGARFEILVPPGRYRFVGGSAPRA
jgi:signal transduction histidine kinase